MTSERHTAPANTAEGVKTFFSGSNTVYMLAAALLYAATALYRLRVFTSARLFLSSGIIPIAAGVLIAFGALCAISLSSHQLTTATPAAGIFLMICGFALYGYVTLRSFSPGSRLWLIADICSLASTAAFVIMLLMLFVSCFGATIGPWIGRICSLIALAAMLTQSIKVLVSFSRIYTVGGTTFDFSSVSRYSSDLMWIYGTHSPDSGMGLKLFLSRLAECLIYLFIQLTVYMMTSSFFDHFDIFNKRLSFIKDLPKYDYETDRLKRMKQAAKKGRPVSAEDILDIPVPIAKKQEQKDDEDFTLTDVTPLSSVSSHSFSNRPQLMTNPDAFVSQAKAEPAEPSAPQAEEEIESAYDRADRLALEESVKNEALIEEEARAAVAMSAEEGAAAKKTPSAGGAKTSSRSNKKKKHSHSK